MNRTSQIFSRTQFLLKLGMATRPWSHFTKSTILLLLIHRLELSHAQDPTSQGKNQNIATFPDIVCPCAPQYLLLEY